jgi:trk system potassium uptake protein TrkA
MKQFAIIGLSSFGIWVLEELLAVDVEVLIVDKDEDVVAQYRNSVQAAYVADAIKEETIRKIVPPDVDAAIIDLGDRTEVSVLVANYLKKLGVRKIIARAETDEHGEILRLVGATDVVFPDREAAKRIMPPLLSNALWSYLPISERLVMAEVSLPSELIGKTVVTADLRQAYGINIIAIKPSGVGEFVFVARDYEFKERDTFLVVGTNENVAALSEEAQEPRAGRLFRQFFRHRESQDEKHS